VIPAGAAFVDADQGRPGGPLVEGFGRGLKTVEDDPVPVFDPRFRFGYAPRGIEVRRAEHFG
jgi:hypothetical protein